MHVNKSSFDESMLDIAHGFAKGVGGCLKVKVGSIIVKGREPIALGANRTDLNLCFMRGCLRQEKYGDNSKAHRNPDDCRAIHSEIDAISRTKSHLDETCTIYVTRYPCEACARAIIASGIKHVVYGRTETISEMTARMFEYNHVGVTHLNHWIEEDNNA